MRRRCNRALPDSVPDLPFYVLDLSPVAGEFASDGGIKDGGTITLEPFLCPDRGRFCSFYPEECRFQLSHNPILLRTGRQKNGKTGQFSEVDARAFTTDLSVGKSDEILRIQSKGEKLTA